MNIIYHISASRLTLGMVEYNIQVLDLLVFHLLEEAEDVRGYRSQQKERECMIYLYWGWSIDVYRSAKLTNPLSDNTEIAYERKSAAERMIKKYEHEMEEIETLINDIDVTIANLRVIKHQLTKSEQIVIRAKVAREDECEHTRDDTNHRICSGNRAINIPILSADFRI
jgi:hypothetical protein